MTRGAVPLRFREIVNVKDFRPRTRDDLLPVNGFHVAQIVIVDQPATSSQNIYKLEKIELIDFKLKNKTKHQFTSYSGHFQIVYFGEGDHQVIFFAEQFGFEERPSADNLQSGQDDTPGIDMRDENVTGYFPNVL